MGKRELVNILNEVLVPIGFKRKGNYWVLNSKDVSKIVNLQKSQFSNSFYINYGYILNAVPLNGLVMHVFMRLSSLDVTESLRITELLDLQTEIADIERTAELKKILLDNLVKEISLINSERDLLDELITQPHLNNIPLVVKKYFNLPE